MIPAAWLAWVVAATARPLDGAFDAPPVAHWTVDLPGGRLNAATHTERARPVVTGDLVLVGSAAGRSLYGLSRRTGALRREYPAAGSVESGAVVVGDDVLFADTGGVVWCYRLDGTLVWRHQTSAPVLSTPTIVGDRVYVANVEDAVVAIDRTTGALDWQLGRKPDPTRSAELELYAAPPPVVSGDVLLVGTSDGALVAIDRERGEVVWEKRIGEGRYPDIVAPPVVDANDAYLSAYYQPLVALDLTTRNVRWRLDVGAASPVTLIDTAGTALVVHPGSDGVMRAVVGLTGATKWTWDSGDEGALTEVLPTPLGLLVGSSDGGLSIVDPELGTTIWSWHGDSQLDGLAAAPTVEGRQILFVTNAGRLHSMVVPRRGEGMERAGSFGWRRSR
jgi:outer membrane protein assembly factor BamB